MYDAIMALSFLFTSLMRNGQIWLKFIFFLLVGWGGLCPRSISASNHWLYRCHHTVINLVKKIPSNRPEKAWFSGPIKPEFVEERKSRKKEMEHHARSHEGEGWGRGLLKFQNVGSWESFQGFLSDIRVFSNRAFLCKQNIWKRLTKDVNEGC